MKLVELFFIINPARFHYLKFILEGYDNIAVLSSVDRHKGIVRVRTTPELYSEVLNLMGQIAIKIQKQTL